MKKFFILMVTALVSVSILAVPAYRGWQTKVQPDGTSIQVRQVGDEYYHYWETQEGTLALEQENGSFVKTATPAPSRGEQTARRAAARAHKAAPVGPNKQKAEGAPNLAPKGVVILVNFSNSRMASSHTRTMFDNMCNATNCTSNGGYPSAAQYFADQSNGAYRPQFDVFGPVTLSHNVAYYGQNNDEDGSDAYLADFVIDAVTAADAAGCDFSQYDSDNDGVVDFVYFIYAGLGEAYGGAAETIWPHNWNLFAVLYLGYTHGNSGYYANDYDYNLPELDGKLINNYACSAELDGYSNLCGIGTLCHEFGHVMGLPDFYDTEYGTNYSNNVTPSEWDIMDAGGYNGEMHCPPNYSPWEKYFFGWNSPVNYGNNPKNLTLYANGSSSYNVVQVNSSGTKAGWGTSGWNYYLENRQQSGWDEYVPAHGMVIWKVDYDEDLWDSNKPNSTSTGSPRLTLVCSSGTEVGSTNGWGNVFGGTNTSYTSWTGVSGKPVKNIRESNGIITATYISAPTPVDSITLYCVNTEEWSNVWAYVWGNDGVTITNYLDWPGEAAKKTSSKVNGKTVYSYTFPSSFNYIIFNDGVNNQTVDMEWPAGQPIFVPEGMNTSGFYYGTWYASLSDISGNAATSGQCGENMYWSFDPSTGVLDITGYGDMYDFEWNTTNFPETPWMNYLDQIQSISFPYGMTSIGNYAFCYCNNITSLTIPNSVTRIGFAAFYYCTGLTSVTIPQSVQSIGDGATFMECTSLTSVKWNAINCTLNLDENLNTYPPFNGLSNITSFTFGSQVQSVPDYLCYGLSGMQSISIPSGVTSIGMFAFANCTGLTTVTIPQNVQTIGKGGTFQDCSGLNSVRWNAKNCAIEAIEEHNFYPPFNGLSNITNFTFGSQVQSIPAGLCYGLSGLSSVTLPSTLTSIGEFAFTWNNGLSELIIPNSVTSIDYGAFGNCTGLSTLTIGSGLLSTGDSAFYNCSNLQSVTCRAIVPPVLGEYAFGEVNCPEIPLYIPEVSVVDYQSADQWEDFYLYTIEHPEDPVTPPTETILYVLSEDDSEGHAYGSGTYPIDMYVEVYAIPSYGYYFSGWSDGNYDNPRVLYMNKAKITLTAQFEAVPTGGSSSSYIVDVTSQDPERGSVTVEQTVRIKAIPEPGYAFAYWSDGNTDNPRSIKLDHDITLRAIFSISNQGVNSVAQDPENMTYKVIINDQVYIIRGDKTFTITGQEVK